MKKIRKKNSIDGDNLPDSCLKKLLDRCTISVNDIKSQSKKKNTYSNKLTGAPFAELFEKSTVTHSSVAKKDYEDNSKKHDEKNKTTAE